MPKLFVSEIQPQMQVDAAFRIADRQLRANRQGNLYLLMQLQDRTGVISAMRWNADEKLAERFVKGSFVQIQGASQRHNGILQLIVNQITAKALGLSDYAVIVRFGLRTRTGVLTTLTLTNYSEFGLDVAALAATSGWLSDEWLVVLSLAVAASFVLAAQMNAASERI